jgi:hypothetical protein
LTPSCPFAHDLHRELERGCDTHVRQPRHQAHRARHARFSEPTGLADQIGNRDPGEIRALEIREHFRRPRTIGNAAHVEGDRLEQRSLAAAARGRERIEPSVARRAKAGRDRLRSAEAEHQIARQRAIREDPLDRARRVLGELEQEREREALVGGALDHQLDRGRAVALAPKPARQPFGYAPQLRSQLRFRAHHRTEYQTRGMRCRTPAFRQWADEAIGWPAGTPAATSDSGRLARNSGAASPQRGVMQSG